MDRGLATLLLLALLVALANLGKGQAINHGSPEGDQVEELLSKWTVDEQQCQD